MTSYIERIYNASFLESKEKLQVKALTRIGSIKMPENFSNPLILITVGAGIARFEGLLQELADEKALKSVGEVFVYYGCKDKDSIFVAELNDLVKRKVIDNLELAISQNIETKKHIQDIIREHKEELYYVIKKRNGIVMTCVSLAMEKNIKEAFMTVFQGKEKDPQEFFEQMKTNRQYVRELWNI